MLRLPLAAVVLGAVCIALVAAPSSDTSTSRPLRYIALGDSFSSGEGDPPYREATDRYLPPHDICHRSFHAYPQLVAGRKSSPGTWGFWACSGARVADMTSPNRQNPIEEAQLDRIAPPGKADPNVDLVTLTIGGNDAQFSIVWMACLASRITSALLGSCQGDWRGFVADAIRHVRAILPGVFRQLRVRAPNARILVLGYPNPFPSVLPADSRCNFWFAPSDLAWLAREAAALNGAIRRAATAAHARITYVTPTGFAGHDVCSASPWFNGLELEPDRIRGSFHPNVLGQRRMALEVLARI
jgi:lysophospholipase L1-like esterase